MSAFALAMLVSIPMVIAMVFFIAWLAEKYPNPKRDDGAGGPSYYDGGDSGGGE